MTLLFYLITCMAGILTGNYQYVNYKHRDYIMLNCSLLSISHHTFLCYVANELQVLENCRSLTLFRIYTVSQLFWNWKTIICMMFGKVRSSTSNQINFVWTPQPLGYPHHSQTFYTLSEAGGERMCFDVHFFRDVNMKCLL